jgi:hypothetical protein
MDMENCLSGKTFSEGLLVHPLKVKGLQLVEPDLADDRDDMKSEQLDVAVVCLWSDPLMSSR